MVILAKIEIHLNKDYPEDIASEIESRIESYLDNCLEQMKEDSLLAETISMGLVEDMQAFSDNVEEYDDDDEDEWDDDNFLSDDDLGFLGDEYDDGWDDIF